MTSPPVASREIGAEIAQISELAAWAEETAAAWGVPPRVMFGLQLCLEEAASNVIRHGFAGDAGPHHRIRVTFRQDTGAATLSMIVEDAAPRFDPRQVAPPARPTDIAAAPVGGLGIALMRRYAAMDYAYEGGMNRLTLRFPLNVAAGGAGV